MPGLLSRGQPSSRSSVPKARRGIFLSDIHVPLVWNWPRTSSASGVSQIAAQFPNIFFDHTCRLAKTAECDGPISSRRTTPSPSWSKAFQRSETQIFSPFWLQYLLKAGLVQKYLFSRSRPRLQARTGSPKASLMCCMKAARASTRRRCSSARWSRFRSQMRAGSRSNRAAFHARGALRWCQGRPLVTSSRYAAVSSLMYCASRFSFAFFRAPSRFFTSTSRNMTSSAATAPISSASKRQNSSMRSSWLASNPKCWQPRKNVASESRPSPPMVSSRDSKPRHISDGPPNSCIMNARKRSRSAPR
mmetsp:Transcript_20685/g.54255  ORF Transcript_20685/g.54255 Transcript_20685/m.54255 type:complete len:304 (+) Transcript_20685:1218-2129(+)